MTLLQIDSLTKRYDSSVAVSGLSFTVGPGEVVGLLGPNGAGKTTTMGCIVGLLTPNTGKVTIDDLEPQSSEAKALVGYAAQRTALYPSLRVSENLEFYGGVYGLRGRILADAVTSTIELFDLASLMDRRIKELSIGQAKLVHLATAVVHRPRLLVVDEPTASLDVAARTRVIDGIRKLASEGTAIVFSTHYLEEVERACHSIVILRDGKAVAADRLDELLAAHSKQVTVIRMTTGETVSFSDRGLLEAINSVDRELIAEVVVERPSVRRIYDSVIEDTDV